MYLAMSRQADREGYPEIAEAYKRIAFEEAEHAAKFAELLGEVVAPDTKKNLEVRVEAEFGACKGKKDLATLAKKLNYDAIHDTVHEMCKDEARHGAAFQGLLNRYFKMCYTHEGKTMDKSMLLETIGNSTENRIIDFLIENYCFEYTKKDIATNCKISSSRAYPILTRLILQGFIKQARKNGKEQLYRLNRNNERAEALLKLEGFLLKKSFETVSEKIKVHA